MKLTPKKCAELAGVSASMVYQWVKERRFPVYRVGGKGRRGRILVEESDIAAFLESLKVEPRGHVDDAGPAGRLRGVVPVQHPDAEAEVDVGGRNAGDFRRAAAGLLHRLDEQPELAVGDRGQEFLPLAGRHRAGAADGRGLPH